MCKIRNACTKCTCYFTSPNMSHMQSLVTTFGYSRVDTFMGTWVHLLSKMDSYNNSTYPKAQTRSEGSFWWYRIAHVIPYYKSITSEKQERLSTRLGQVGDLNTWLVDLPLDTARIFLLIGPADQMSFVERVHILPHQNPRNRACSCESEKVSRWPSTVIDPDMHP